MQTSAGTYLHMIALKNTLLCVLNAFKDYRLAFRDSAELASKHDHSRRSLKGNSRKCYLFFSFFCSIFTKQKTILWEHPEIQNWMELP